MAERRAVSEQQPPEQEPPGDAATDATGATDGRGQQPPPAPKPRAARSSGRRDKLGRLEDRLNEMFASAAIAQAGLGAITGDTRHLAGSQVTSELGPSVVGAWVQLARENDRVADVLMKLTEGSAWGQVILATGGFAFAQAQAYGMAPSIFSTMPWFQEPVVPPSPEGAAHAAGNMNGTPPPFPFGRSPEDARSGVDEDEDPAHVLAEQQRLAAEERRRQQQQG